MKKLNIAKEAEELLKLIKYLYRDGYHPNTEGLEHLFEWRAKEYLKILESMGNIKIKNGKIINIDY